MKIKYCAGKRYRLAIPVESSDGSRFEPGEKFVYQPRVFVSEYDQAKISIMVASKVERATHKPMFEEVLA